MISSEVPWGFYRDRQGRVMQVSFDFGRRVWLGVGYAPRLRPTGETEISPAAFDFGAAWDQLAPDGRTRHRFRVLDGQVRLHSFGSTLSDSVTTCRTATSIRCCGSRRSSASRRAATCI